jgi:hypothetical protein
VLTINAMHWVGCIMPYGSAYTSCVCVVDSDQFNFIDAQNLITFVYVHFFWIWIWI